MNIFKRPKIHKPGKPEHREEDLEGVITFFGAHHALKGERMLAAEGLRVMLIPGPREISPNCGTALRFDFDDKEEIKRLLDGNRILFEEIHYYPVRGV